jgi:hypothetical protein
MVTVIDIFGEIHTLEERNRIEKQILASKIPYQYLLAEEIGTAKFLTKREQEIGRSEDKFQTGSLIYDLAIKLKVPLIGIDLDDDDEIYKHDIVSRTQGLISAVHSFKLRETQMVKVISEYAKKGNCAVIMGDTHLRTIVTKELGDISLIQKEFGNSPGFNIIRSPIKEIN